MNLTFVQFFTFFNEIKSQNVENRISQTFVEHFLRFEMNAAFPYHKFGSDNQKEKVSNRLSSS
jgi:hypothetical protein